jgi:hypothetical protein
MRPKTDSARPAIRTGLDPDADPVVAIARLSIFIFVEEADTLAPTNRLATEDVDDYVLRLVVHAVAQAWRSSLTNVFRFMQAEE